MGRPIVPGKLVIPVPKQDPGSDEPKKLRPGMPGYIDWMRDGVQLDWDAVQQRITDENISAGIDRRHVMKKPLPNDMPFLFSRSVP